MSKKKSLKISIILKILDNLYNFKIFEHTNSSENSKGKINKKNTTKIKNITKT